MSRVSAPSRTFPLIFAAPSGAGKTTIAKMLRERRDDVAFSVSATTRLPRGYEVEGRDYFFVTEAKFRQMVAAGEFAEWAEVHGNLYGTPLRNLEEAVARGVYLVLDIDVQGAQQIRQAVPEAIGIFILPPSGEELAQRLTGRGSEDGAVRRRRLANAQRELAEAVSFEYVIVNDDLECSVRAVEAIIEGESFRSRRMPELGEIISEISTEVDAHLR